MFELIRATYEYENGATALDDATLTIAQGCATALTGANGSGKTTLLKMLNGLIVPTRGEYRFDGSPINKKTLSDASFAKEFHRRVGFVFQNSDAQLFCGSVEDEIAFGPRQLELPESELRRRVDDCLALLKIEHLRFRAPYALSGGEKRRVAFACVLALNPDALVCDEPLANLDEESCELTLGLFKSLKASGKTLIFATHNEDLVRELADARIRLNKGRVAAIEERRLE